MESALREEMTVNRAGLMHPTGVVQGPEQPVKDFPNSSRAPAAGRV